MLMVSRPMRMVRPLRFGSTPAFSTTVSSLSLVPTTNRLGSVSEQGFCLSSAAGRSRRAGLQYGLAWRGLATGQTNLKRREEDEPLDISESQSASYSFKGRTPREVEPNQAVPATQSQEEAVTATPAPTTTPPIETSETVTNSDGTTSLIRPTIPFSQVPFVAPSPLNLSVPPYPPIATSVIREAIADFLSAEKSAHVVPVPQEVYDKKSYFGWRVFYWRTKQLFKFYWAGCKCLRANYSHMRTLQKGVRREGWELTRREKRFVSRTQADLWKIVPFVFFLMTLEEILPLMVLYTPWLLPSTTILPSQFLRIKSAEEVKRREALLEVGKELRRVREEDVGAESSVARSRGGLPVLAGLSPEVVKGLCKALDLGTVAPMFWLQRRLTRRIS